MLSSMIKDNIEILMVSETKIDSSFQFRIEGYAPPFRYDRNFHGGCIFLFIREDIPTRIISMTPLKNFEGIFVELNFRKEKIILCYSYNPQKNLISIIWIFSEKYWICKLKYTRIYNKWFQFWNDWMYYGEPLWNITCIP